MRDIRFKLVAAAAGLFLCSMAYFQLQAAAVLLLSIPEERPEKRRPNKKRNRAAAMERLSGFTDEQIKSHTGLSRTQFNYVASLIKPALDVNKIMAQRSSGSHIPTHLRFFIACRLLKGAKQLDVEWMDVATNHSWDSCMIPCLRAIDKSLDNVVFKPKDETWLKETEAGWLWNEKRKYGVQVPGTLLAGDGLILKIGRLAQAFIDATGIPLRKYWNRKGFFGLNVQAFCDAWCRICILECIAPGATHDLTAYTNGPCFETLLADLPDYYHFILDEAYKSIKDGKHITPFPGDDIKKEISKGHHNAANAMRTFNKIFCSDRITIERAFGILVRRWAILWLALPTINMEEIQLILRVCVKLHNLCVDEWLCEKFGFATEEGRVGTGYPTPDLSGVVAGTVVREGNMGSPFLPEPEINELQEAHLLNERNFKALRGGLNDDGLDIAVDGQNGILVRDRAALSATTADTDSATAVAGRAMANGAEQSAGSPDTDYDIRALVNNQQYNRRTVHKGADKRLSISRMFQQLGLSWAGGLDTLNQHVDRYGDLQG